MKGAYSRQSWPPCQSRAPTTTSTPPNASMPSWWPSWGSDKPKKSDSKPELAKKLNDSLKDIPRQTDDLFDSLYAQAAALPPHLRIFTVFLLGGTSALAVYHVYARYFKRIPNSGWVTPKMLAKRRWIKGYVTRCVSLIVPGTQFEWLVLQCGGCGQLQSVPHTGHRMEMAPQVQKDTHWSQ